MIPCQLVELSSALRSVVNQPPHSSLLCKHTLVDDCAPEDQAGMSLPLHEQADRPSEDYVYAPRVERVRCASGTAPALRDGATSAHADASSFVRSDVHDADIQRRDPEPTHTVSAHDTMISVVLTYVVEAASAETAHAPYMCPDTGL
jgi:hypothetical protein